MIELLQKYVKNDGAVVVRQARSERKYDSLARRAINSNGFPYSTRIVDRERKRRSASRLKMESGILLTLCTFPCSSYVE